MCQAYRFTALIVVGWLIPIIIGWLIKARPCLRDRHWSALNITTFWVFNWNKLWWGFHLWFYEVQLPIDAHIYVIIVVPSVVVSDGDETVAVVHAIDAITVNLIFFFLQSELFIIVWVIAYTNFINLLVGLKRGWLTQRAKCLIFEPLLQTDPMVRVSAVQQQWYLLISVLNALLLLHCTLHEQLVKVKVFFLFPLAVKYRILPQFICNIRLADCAYYLWLLFFALFFRLLLHFLLLIFVADAFLMDRVSDIGSDHNMLVVLAGNCEFLIFPMQFLLLLFFHQLAQ